MVLKISYSQTDSRARPPALTGYWRACPLQSWAEVPGTKNRRETQAADRGLRKQRGHLYVDSPEASEAAIPAAPSSNSPPQLSCLRPNREVSGQHSGAPGKEQCSDGYLHLDISRADNWRKKLF